MDNQTKEKLKLFNRQWNILIIATTIIITLLVATAYLHVSAFVILLCLNIAFFFIFQRFSRFFAEAMKKNAVTIEALKCQAQTDKLTQLLNRNGLEQSLTTVWAFSKRYQKNIGFIMVDIDCFKNYNDTLGHFEGDNILKQVSEAIRACCKRETDIVSRIGGEEFLIVLSDISEQHIVRLAQDISHSIADLKIENVGQYSCSPFLSVSMGIAVATPKDEFSSTDLYKIADSAMYQAKDSGRNCICFKGSIINPHE